MTTCSCSWKKYKNIQSTNENGLKSFENVSVFGRTSYCGCHIILASLWCWYSYVYIYIYNWFSLSNMVSNKYFFEHRRTWLKTQCSTVQRWSSVARYVCFCIFWQHSGTTSACHHKLVSLSRLLSCLRRLCRFSPPLAQLSRRKNRIKAHCFK